MAKPPVTVRLDDNLRETLDRLSLDSTPSDVLRRGLQLVAGAELSAGAPLYPRLVDEPAIDDVVEDAAKAACEVLDQLFPERAKERQGISSNFQGTLKEHIVAMLTGRVAATYSHHRELNTLFGDDRVLGRVAAAGPQQGYAVARLPDKPGEDRSYFDAERGRFVPLPQLQPGDLFTSDTAAVKAVYAWLGAQGMSPREHRLRLCVLSFEGDGPLQMVSEAP